MEEVCSYGYTEGTTNYINLLKNGLYHIERCYKIVNASQYSQNISIEMRSDYLASGSVIISNFKAVLGKKEILSDGTDNILYDESGLGNNAKLEGNENFLPLLTYSTDAKIGEGCYQSRTKTSDWTNSYGIIRTSKIFYEVPEISIAFWLYVPESDGNTEDNTIIGCSANMNNHGIWIKRNGIDLTATLYQVSLNSVIKLKRNAWQYIVVTAQKNGTLNIYIDGELSATKSDVSGVDWEDAYFVIGDLRSNRVLNLDGKIDDLRVYATTLDEIYIKRLYKEKEKVDKEGNIFCNELIENIDNNIFSFENIMENETPQNIEDSVFSKNSVIITSLAGEKAPRFFRVLMKLSAGTYKIFRICNIISNNYTDSTGHFYISSRDWSKNFLNLTQNDDYGTLTLSEDTEVHITFVASEEDENTEQIIAQFILYIYTNNKQKLQETKFLDNGQIKTYNLQEKDNNLTKIFNNKKTIQTETLYEY